MLQRSDLADFYTSTVLAGGGGGGGEERSIDAEIYGGRKVKFTCQSNLNTRRFNNKMNY